MGHGSVMKTLQYMNKILFWINKCQCCEQIALTHLSTYNMIKFLACQIISMQQFHIDIADSPGQKEQNILVNHSHAIIAFSYPSQKLKTQYDNDYFYQHSTYIIIK